MYDNQKIDEADIEALWLIVNNMTGFDLDEDDFDDEVIIKTLILLKLNEIEKELQKKLISISFTQQVSQFIYSKLSGGKNTIKQINQLIKNTVLKFFLKESNRLKLINGSKYIVDVLDSKLIFRHSIAFDIAEGT